MKLADLSAYPGNPLSGEWRKSFNFAIGLHILVMIITLTAPVLFDRKPELPEVYTVNLFTATEVAVEQPAPKAPPRKATQKAAVKQTEPVKPKVSTVSKSIAEEKLVAPIEKVDIKPVSLRPVKKKIKIGKTEEETAKEKARLSKAFERVQARAHEKEAKKEADQAAIEAVSKLADSLKTTEATTETSKVKPGTGTRATPGVLGPRTTGIEPDFYMKQYYSAIVQNIHENWILSTNLQELDKSVTASVVIIINRDGIITNRYFEKKSNNVIFNRMVLKTINDSSPLPPFPSQLKQNSMEIELRFHSGGLY
jgi:outer membrane biosynthesis protein TonB